MGPQGPRAQGPPQGGGRGPYAPRFQPQGGGGGLRSTGLQNNCISFRKVKFLALEELLDEEMGAAEVASCRARAAKFVAARLCVPRDMGAEAGAVLRATLLERLTLWLRQCPENGDVLTAQAALWQPGSLSALH